MLAIASLLIAVGGGALVDGFRALWNDSGEIDDWYRSGYIVYGGAYQFDIAFAASTTLELNNSFDTHAGERDSQAMYALLSLRSTPRRAAALAADAFSVDVDVQVGAGRYPEPLRPFNARESNTL